MKSDFEQFADLPDEAYAERLRQDDLSLSIAAHEGDQLASLVLLERYFAPVLNLVLAATGLMSVAEETAQAVLAGRLRHLSDHPPSSDDERWIVLLSRHAWRLLLELGMAAHKPARRIRISPSHWEADRLQLGDDVRPSPRRVAQRLRHHLWLSFSRLSLQQRFVLALTERHQVSLEELALVLDVDVGEARRRRDRAKLSLLRRLPGRLKGRWSGRT